MLSCGMQSPITIEMAHISPTLAYKNDISFPISILEPNVNQEYL